MRVIEHRRRAPADREGRKSFLQADAVLLCVCVCVCACECQYGMNFWIGDFNGEKLVWHQGDVWGFRALVAFLPESDIGVVLLSNSDSADSIAPNQMWWRSIIEFYLFDLVQQNPNPTFPNGAADMCNVRPNTDA